MAQPVWITPAGSLGTVPEGVFFQVPLIAQEPEGATVKYQVIAGELPPGVQCNTNGVIVGTPQAVASVQGVPEEVSRDVTSKFAVRAYTTTTINGVTVINRLADRTFSLTVTGQDAPEFVTPAGNIGTYFDGTQITDLQIEYTDTDPDDVVVVKLAAGRLPPGLNLSPTGLISGYIAPLAPNEATAGFSRDEQGYDEYSFDFDTMSTNSVYEFVLEVTDGVASNLRTFTITVYSRDSLTADDTDITADNTFVTADGTPIRTPLLLTPPGSIGNIRSDNFFAYKFNGIDPNGNQIVYVMVPSDALNDLNLTLDPASGWLYGYIPDQGLTEETYSFAIQVYVQGNPSNISGEYDFTLTVRGAVDTEIIWLTPGSATERAKTPASLGTINNGGTSMFYVEAVNTSGIPLQYRLKSGSNSDLPQGLTLLSSGHIAGRVSFDTFALDGGTTTFDVDSRNLTVTAPTTFDLKHIFTVEAFSSDGRINVAKQFSITVNRAYNEPYDNLYIQAMPPENDRALVQNLLEDTTIIPPTLLYRSDDPNFGRATRVVYDHAFGLTSATYADYVSSLYENHYWKNLILGSIETAQAVDAAGNVIYEVVYSRIIGGLTNDQGESVSKEVALPYPVNANTPDQIDTVYPNSLPNMRDQVIDTVGQISNELPLWMISKQADGRVLGFTPAWVICYTKPGESGQIAYNIRTQFGVQLNQVDFEVDRYELDRLLSINWDPATGSWVPSPPQATTFDYGDVYAVSVTAGGNDYNVGDTFTVSGADLGGEDGVNDAVLEVLAINESTGAITAMTISGTAVFSAKGTDFSGIDPTADTSTGDGLVVTISVPNTTVFDGNSLQFIDPVDMYSNSTDYDKYLVFPKRTILG